MSLNVFFRQLRIRFRLIVSVVMGAAIWAVLPQGWVSSTRTILALDGGGAIFLTLSWLMMVQATPERMRLRARIQDEAKGTILALTVGAMVFSMAAIGIELGGLKEVPPAAVQAHIALAAVSIICSWPVTHTIFALHYAHAYYGDADLATDNDADAGGLEFPGGGQPDYWDFLYFAFVIGMTCQTSDVQVTGRGMRRLCLAQGVLSFVFNTVILAMSINIAAGLL